MAAIFAKIEGMTFPSPIMGVTTWQTTSTRLKLWADVPIKPGAYLVTHKERDEYRGLGLLRRRLELGIWCYTTASDAEPGQDQLDTLMQAFENTFNIPDDYSTNSNTLGGLVYWCRIEGQVFKDPGDIDNDTMLIVPLVVEMP